MTGRRDDLGDAINRLMWRVVLIVWALGIISASAAWCVGVWLIW